MLSTPILNPPQCAILGMHAITERAVVEKGEIVIRPIMYLALSYDHRLVDGHNLADSNKATAEIQPLFT
jgi:2-oxoglutarate dehydrogenase E2 component (dihydrolipoamide succinyltransferase)